MPFMVGVVLALGVTLFARVVGLDKDRAFYPTVLIVVALYYILFAAISGSSQTLLAELIPMVGFVALAVVGFRTNEWIVVAGLAGHGAFDAIHSTLVTNTGMPAWWPAFCLAYDVGAAAGLAWVIGRGERPRSYRSAT